MNGEKVFTKLYSWLVYRYVKVSEFVQIVTQSEKQKWKKKVDDEELFLEERQDKGLTRTNEMYSGQQDRRITC